MQGARDSTNQRRVYVDQSERRSSKLDQSERSSHARYPSDGIKGTAPSFLRISFSDRYQQHVNLCGNRRSLAKTRLPRLVVWSQVPFRRGAIRGHYTVAPPITVPVDQ